MSILVMVVFKSFLAAGYSEHRNIFFVEMFAFVAACGWQASGWARHQNLGMGSRGANDDDDHD